MNAQPDPIARFQELFAEAMATGIDLQEGMTLSTVGTDGSPSARIVLLKTVDEEGFVFYTNMESRKGAELRKDPRACLLFWWRELLSQVRVDGAVTVVDDAEADAYFASRPRESRLGAWASNQSQPLAAREELLAKYRDFEALYEGREVPRPPHWSGYRLRPRRIEFWSGMPSRLHDRDVYTRSGDEWTLQKLYP